MIAPAIDYIAEKINDDLAFADRVAGLVRTVSTNTQGKITRFPVSCNVSDADCIANGTLRNLVPDSKLKSLIYFEENGSRFVGRTSRGLEFEAQATLVCWLNLNKLGQTSCEASIYAQAQLVKLLTSIKNINIAPLNLVNVTSLSFPKKSAAIFSQYTYDEAKQQYLIYPHDYFAIAFTLRYEVPLGCINNDWINAEIPC
jgi:hypothetical protein